MSAPNDHLAATSAPPAVHRRVAWDQQPAAVERRRFLQLGATVGVGASVAASPLLSGLVGARPMPTSVATGQAYVPVAAYPAGVVSGDPSSSGVVLWTRIDPVVAGAGATVGWQVASEPTFAAGSI